MQYLQDQGLLGSTPDDIAEFFHNDDRLDKASFIAYFHNIICIL